MSIARRRLRAIAIVLGGILLWTGWTLDLPAITLAVEPLDAHPADPGPFFTVSQIRYMLDPIDLGRISQIRFDFQTSGTLPPSARVQAKLLSNSTSYTECEQTAPSSSHWECSLANVPVAAVDELSLKLVLRPGEPPYMVFLPVVNKGGRLQFLPVVAKP